METPICKITNGQFSYFLEVDGENFSFDGGSASDYFEKHYKELGYIIEKYRCKVENKDNQLIEVTVKEQTIYPAIVIKNSEQLLRLLTKEDLSFIGSTLGWSETVASTKGRHLLKGLFNELKDWEFNEILNYGECWKIVKIFKYLIEKYKDRVKIF